MEKHTVVLSACVIALSLLASHVLADPPDEGRWESRKEQMKHEREHMKRVREWEKEDRKRYREMEREERKHFEEMEREEWKHYKEMEREERKHLEEMERESYEVREQPAYEYRVDEPYQPDYVEDKVYRIIKDARDIKDTIDP